MSIDIAGSLRRSTAEKRRGALRPRERRLLVQAADLASEGRALLMLDTNVYIHAAAGTLPVQAAGLVARGLMFHCAVCLGELAVGVGNADPRRAGWKKMKDYYGDLVSGVPASRVLTPDAEIWADAGVVAGFLARTQGYQTWQRKECLNDALIYLTAAKMGVAVLTANRDEFDLIQQVAGRGRFVWF